MYSKIAVLLLVASVSVAIPEPHDDDYQDEPLPRGPAYDVRDDGYRGGHYIPKPFDYGYETKDEHGSRQHRHESGDGHGRVTGSYGYNDPWGVYRHVDYIADEHGFRAKVKTNEPGTANQDPAAVEIHSDARFHGAPARRYHPEDKYDEY